MLTFQNIRFPVEVDPDVDQLIETSDFPELVITMYFSWELPDYASTLLWSLLGSYDDGIFQRPVSRSMPISIQYFVDSAVLTAVWDFSREDAQSVLFTFFRALHILPVERLRLETQATHRWRINHA